MSRRQDVKGHNFKWMIYAMDVIIILIVFFAFVHIIVPWLGYFRYDSSSRFYWNRFGHAFLFLLSYFCAVNILKIKNKDLDSRLETVFKACGEVIMMYVVFIIIGALLFHTFSTRLIACTGMGNLIFMSLSHYWISKAVIRYRQKPENELKIIFVGTNPINLQLSDKLKNGFSTFSYREIGFFTDDEPAVPLAECPILGCVKDVPEYLERNDIDEVYCSLRPTEWESDINNIVKTCEEKFISFYYVPNVQGCLHRQMEFSQNGDITLVSIRKEPLSDAYNRGIKRAFDIICSGLFLLLIYPFVWLFVAVGTKITSPGPILFRQKRTGMNGKSFTMLKFRSMKVNADADIVQATEDDPRKTKFGDFLRRTSIDELPQFINVFRGEMSIVGPRPHMELHTEMYSKLVDEYLVRHLCKPGITGWAQVNGCRGETKKVEEMAERVKHDIWYIEHWSLLLDMRIVTKTVRQVFSGDSQAY